MKNIVNIIKEEFDKADTNGKIAIIVILIGIAVVLYLVFVLLIMLIFDTMMTLEMLGVAIGSLLFIYIASQIGQN
jgi:uncharacterized membrane protein